MKYSGCMSDDLRKQLATAAAAMGPDRILKVMAVLHQAFEARGFMTPVLVGGGAVEYYTHGGYTTGDIDALMYTPHEIVDEVMAGLGFTKFGKDWSHHELGLHVEFPGTVGDNEYFSETRVDVGGVPIRIQSLEATIFDRFLWVAQGYTADAVPLLTLVVENMEVIDWDRLRTQAEQELALPLLERLKSFAEQTDWADPPSPEAIEDHLKSALRPSIMEPEASDDE